MGRFCFPFSANEQKISETYNIKCELTKGILSADGPKKTIVECGIEINDVRTMSRICTGSGMKIIASFETVATWQPDPVSGLDLHVHLLHVLHVC